MKSRTVALIVASFGVLPFALTSAKASDDTATEGDPISLFGSSTSTQGSTTREDEFWLPLRFEPLNTLDSARTDYRRHEERAAADAMEKAVSWLRLAASSAQPKTRAKLLDAASQLKVLAGEVRAGNVAAAAKLDPSLAKAAEALAEWHYFKADRAMGVHDEAAASRDMELAAKYLRNAAQSAHYQFDPSTRGIVMKMYTKGTLGDQATPYDHATLASNLEGIQRATTELANAVK